MGRLGRFWYDFLVGDRWELLLGPIAALAIAAALVGSGIPGAAAGVVLAGAVVAVAAFSLWWAVR
ncbi:MAG TPA: hypothetical protein VKR30_02840 [Candidatus Limnocylindrales bacterium]|nr:hypothetical protein [Candidatus Limnocylindrales bacterium]